MEGGAFARVDRETETLGKRPAFPIRLEGIGWFPNPHNPRVLWTGVKAGPELGEARVRYGRGTRASGSRAGNEEVLAASDSGSDQGCRSPWPPRQAIAQLPSVDFGSFTADRFYLYLSKPGPSGSIYTKLAEFPLIAE